MAQKLGIEVVAATGPGILHQLTGVIAAHQGDIISVSRAGDERPHPARVSSILT